jgi:hypothetical protein
MGVHDDVTCAWERAVDHWDDPVRHDAVFAAVVQHNGFAWAAARYKERAGDAIADAQLERLRKAATATLLATATARDDRHATPYRKVMVWFAVLVVMLLLGLVFARVVIDTTPRRDPTPARR